MGTEVEVVWSFVGKIAAFLGVLVTIHQGYTYLYKKSPTGKLEDRMKDVEDKQKRDFEHLRKIDERLDKLELSTIDTQEQLRHVNEGIQRIGKSQIALLRHTIDGNGIEKMREEADDLTDFFINR